MRDWSRDMVKLRGWSRVMVFDWSRDMVKVRGGVEIW